MVSTFQSYEVPGLRPESVTEFEVTTTDVQLVVPVTLNFALYDTAPLTIPQLSLAPEEVMFVVVNPVGVVHAIDCVAERILIERIKYIQVRLPRKIIFIDGVIKRVRTKQVFAIDCDIQSTTGGRRIVTKDKEDSVENL